MLRRHPDRRPQSAHRAVREGDVAAMAAGDVARDRQSPARCRWRPDCAPSSSRTNGLNTSSRRSSGMPGPSSSTVTVSQPRSCTASTSHRSGVAQRVADDIVEQPVEGVRPHMDLGIAGQRRGQSPLAQFASSLDTLEIGVDVEHARDLPRLRLGQRPDSLPACAACRRCRLVSASRSPLRSRSAPVAAGSASGWCADRGSPRSASPCAAPSAARCARASG